MPRQSRTFNTPYVFPMNLTKQFLCGCGSFFLVGLIWLSNGLGAWGKDTLYQDVYLTHRRVCRQCRIEVAGPQSCRLINQAGLSERVLTRDILGVDVHPVQRKILDHLIHNLNPTTMDVLFPDSHYGAENEFYGRYKPHPYLWDNDSAP